MVPAQRVQCLVVQDANPRRKPKHYSPRTAAQPLPEACKITRILTRPSHANGSKYDQKVTCCGGALAFSEPDKSYVQINKIIESAYDHGAEMIVTPCPVCQMNVEVYQDLINKKFNKKFKIPVVYYSQLMAVAYGASAKEAGLDGNIVRATKLEAIAAKK